MSENSEMDLAAQIDAAVKSNMPDMGKIVADALKAAAETPADGKAEKLFAPATNRGIDDRDTRTGVRKIGTFVALLAQAKGDPERAAKVAKDSGDEFMAKALVTTDFTAGGALVPTQFLDDYFEALRPLSIVRAMGARVVDMVDGSAVLPGITGGATANYKEQSAATNADQPTTGDVRMTEKELISIVPVSQSMFRSRSGRNMDMIAQDALNAMAQAENTNFINGTGTNSTPKGILNLALAANITAASGATLAAADTDIAALENVLSAANVSISAGAYFTTTTIFNNLKKLRSGDLRAYPELRAAAATLESYPVFRSNVVPAGYLGFANMDDVIIADSQNIEVTMSEDAAYLNSSGVMVSAYSRNEVVMRLVAKHDIALRYNQSVAAKTGATYAGS